MSVLCSARSSRCTSVVTSSRRRFRFFSAPGGVSALCGSARPANVSWTPHPLMAPQASASMDGARRAGRRLRRRGQCWGAGRRGRGRRAGASSPAEDGPQPVAEAGEARAGGRRRRRGPSSTRASSFCAAHRHSAKSTVSAHVRATPGAASVPRSRPSAAQEGQGRRGARPRRELHEAREPRARRRAGRRGGPPSWRRRSGTTAGAGFITPASGRTVERMRAASGGAGGLGGRSRGRWGPLLTRWLPCAPTGAAPRSAFRAHELYCFGHTKPSMEKCSS